MLAAARSARPRLDTVGKVRTTRQEAAVSTGMNLPADYPTRLQRIRSRASYAWFTAVMISLAVVVIFLLLLVKSRTIGSANAYGFLLAYTVFVTTFELSRLIGAAFYRGSFNKIVKTAERQIAGMEQEYEPSITFVIPCKNEGDAIRKTVEKCLAAQYPAHKVDVIVINDGSTDSTKGVLKDLYLENNDRLSVINWAENRGKRHGMAAGFKQAKGDIVIQLDSDSYIEPGTIREFVKPFANPEVGAICAHADPENADKNLLTKMQAAYYFMSFRVLKSAESVFMTVFCCSGCSSAYRKSIVLPIMDEWLDEKFLGKSVTWGDDRALTNWVLKKGYKTIYSDKAQAYTICPENIRQFLKQQVRWKKGWMVNSIFVSRFIVKQNPFVAFTYFFPLVALTILTPFVAFKALVYNPIVLRSVPLYYFYGVALITILMVIFYRLVARENKYWKYLLLWSGINTFLLSFVLFYAIATIQNRKWGTR